MTIGYARATSRPAKIAEKPPRKRFSSDCFLTRFPVRDGTAAAAGVDLRNWHPLFVIAAADDGIAAFIDMPSPP